MANIGDCPRCNREKPLTSIDPEDPDKLKRICEDCWRKIHRHQKKMAQ